MTISCCGGSEVLGSRSYLVSGVRCQVSGFRLTPVGTVDKTKVLDCKSQPAASGGQWLGCYLKPET
jgi:hypothetical protein